ncbi:E3 ubiquitin-protein ligase NRDP1 [Parus major]|uniref:E3 ubiquitin-protein ligase NRDP1 n=1 Tax=Parus major TaxID=9157 RepID=UPI001443B7A9|nr:E3 ubiquitin-protein ligase NRDP1 [Parus major]
MRNMLSKLQITCDNAVFGCTAVVRLDNLMAHLNDCEHNPKRPVTCEQGCGPIPKSHPKPHPCPRRWVNSLQPARVTRWGGMISTPDAVLQAVIKRSLVESGCPASITNELIENAHERNWPQGLATLETRQMNRRYYENYVAKRIPGKQAVVVMACENQHMGEDMVLEPGLVMIFAHGVEEI